MVSRCCFQAVLGDIEFALVFAYQDGPWDPQGLASNPSWESFFRHLGTTRCHILSQGALDPPEETKKGAQRRPNWSLRVSEAVPFHA